MDIIQKHPNDPKYNEFHDGEYEYWPMRNPSKTKKISFSASSAGGLMLIVAAAAAGLLAFALTVLYVASAPRAIYENSAIINVTVYNNTEEHDVVYTLSTKAYPEEILCEGVLEGDQDTLFLKDLSSGTTYLLLYYDSADADREQIGRFEFTTLGIEPAPVPEEPSEPLELPTDPTISTDPTVSTDPPSTDPPSTDPEETTQPEGTTESATEPSEPTYNPPVVTPPSPGTELTDPPTEPTAEPPTEPEEPPTEPEKPVVVQQPEIGAVDCIVVRNDSGFIESAYYQCQEIHTFQNIPDGEYDIEITQTNSEGTNVITEYTAVLTDGTLTVSFTGGYISDGELVETTVTVTHSTGIAVSQNTISPPSLEPYAILEVEKQEDGSYTFTVTVMVVSNSGETMNCTALLYTSYEDYTGVELELTLDPSTSSGTLYYTATYNTFIDPTAAPEAYVTVTGSWSRVDGGEYYQVANGYCDYP